MTVLLALLIVFCIGVLVGFLFGSSLDARAQEHDEKWEGVGPTRRRPLCNARADAPHHVYAMRGRGNATRLEETL